MKYRSGKRKNNTYVNLFLGGIAFVLFLYFWTPFKAFIAPVTEPVMRVYQASKIGTYIVPQSVRTYFYSRHALDQKDHDLQVNIERLENELAERDARIRELELTSQALPSSSVPVIVMYPIAEDVTKIYSTVLLSKGYKDGVEKGGLVFIRGMQPVCEIVEVRTSTSLCELLSKSGKVIDGVTASSSILLSLQGAGGGNFTADLPKGTVVTEGDTIYLRSDESYVLGTVVSVVESEQDTGAKVYVRGTYNPVTSSIFYLKAKHVD